MASYPITDIDEIEPDMALKLKSVGIRTTGRLLEAEAAGGIDRV